MYRVKTHAISNNAHHPGFPGTVQGIGCLFLGPGISCKSPGFLMELFDVFLIFMTRSICCVVLLFIVVQPFSVPGKNRDSVAGFFPVFLRFFNPFSANDEISRSVKCT